MNGVWTTKDPIGIAGGFNVYGYVLNNPVNYTDLLGLWTFGIDISGTAGAALGLTGGATFVIDHHGNSAVVPHGGGGFLVGGGVSGSIQLQVTTANNVTDLSGGSTSTGVSAGLLVGGTVEVIDGNGYVGVNSGAYAGPGLPVTVHHMAEIACVNELNSPEDSPEDSSDYK